MKTYLALIRNDIRLAFRQKMVIFFNYLMPFAFFFIFFLFFPFIYRQRHSCSLNFFLSD